MRPADNREVILKTCEAASRKSPGGRRDDTPVAPDSVVDYLVSAHRQHRLPAGIREHAERFAYGMLSVLFPHFAAEPRRGRDELAAELSVLAGLLEQPLEWPRPGAGDHTARPEIADELFGKLRAIREALLRDAQAIYDGDPAARSVDEVILAYPGFLAIATYRIAHELYGRIELFPRLVTEVAHRATGIDIHPGAQIGPSFAIDHGTGIVIGETSVIGARVRLYQGVTLGAVKVNKGLERVKRHPTIGDDVVIYANATILGGETVIGRGSHIGGNVWLTRSVPPYSVVTPTARVERQPGRSQHDYELMDFHI
jgi:serine O-acetyltransferase